MKVDDIIKIIEALAPLLVGILAASASLIGVQINNKRLDARTLNDSRSQSVSSLFTHINELERNLILIELMIKTKQDIEKARQESVVSVRKISAEYDKTAIFLPNSISQIIESILLNASTLNADLLLGVTKEDKILDEVASTIKRVKRSKNELREVFQHMIGIKK